MTQKEILKAISWRDGEDDEVDAYRLAAFLHEYLFPGDVKGVLGEIELEPIETKWDKPLSAEVITHDFGGVQTSHYDDVVCSYCPPAPSQKEQWMPQTGDSFWWVTSMGTVQETIVTEKTDTVWMKAMCDFIGVFRTKEEASEAAIKIHEFAKKVLAE